jgi:glutathione S-transferase
MPYVDIVTALALIQFIYFGFRVGGARGRYGVKAPATTGNEIFERHFRVQQNTLESLVALIPGLYVFSRYWNPLWAAGLGVVYLVGRQVYAGTYV